MHIRSILSGLMFGCIVSLIAPSLLAEEAVQPVSMGAADGVDYVSGGIGETELDMMQGRAKDFPLELVFVQKSKLKEEYLADIKVSIEDAHKNVVLDTITEGPYLFVNLPQGRFTITAVYNKDSKVKKVHIFTKKHQKIVFWWPVLGTPEFDLQLQELEN